MAGSGNTSHSAPDRKGDRHQITLTRNRKQSKVGPIRSTLRIQIDDDQWPSIEIPISGAIVDD